MPIPIFKGDSPIVTLEQWFELAGPKGKDVQWVDGRSAKECARAWLEELDTVPPEISQLLQQLDGGPLVVERVEPEALLTFDGHGGPRCADIAMWATNTRGPVAITVEAKADESFDRLLPEVLVAGLERRLKLPASGAFARATELVQALFGSRGKGEPRLDQMRYQLMTAVAGTLAMAQRHNASRAVVIIHEFHSTQTSRTKLQANARDLDVFVNRLSRGAVTAVEPGVLHGPFTVPGAPLFAKPASLYVGKAIRVVGEPTP
ncbi:hypothetical protein [Gemmatimonas sp.]|uniref:DUF6946 family protein n=1 Tax=Gemmatimonas sp. TaxID=1962908 RepID=UPI0025C3A780|nr:hypothetical protein [Gemmatimonas sp.]MCA2991695.1 hypothetical protein [Gemmatimonas sp.]